jgi:predicted dehydrogenase
MPDSPLRSNVLLASAAGGVAPEATPPGKVYRIGAVSAAVRGKSQRNNGHTWHFAHYLHPEINLDAVKKYHNPGSGFEKIFKWQREPAQSFGLLPFPDTRITHVYDIGAESAKEYAEAFPGVKVATKLEDMVKEVDAIWMGDGSGFGDDHFDLVAPGLARGLPTFCDKPIGGTVEGTRKILEFARKHQAPIMSSSLFRHEQGTEMAVRMRDSGAFGPLQYVMACIGGDYSPDRWLVYSQHPFWTVMTLCGAGVEAVSLYTHEYTGHALVTYPNRMPAHVWQGRPDVAYAQEYCSTSVHFTKKTFTYTPSIDGDFGFGHHYEMFRMAAVFRDMVKTRKEPIPHQEILEVTACVHAGVKSLKEKSRLVALAEVMG